MTVRFYRWLPPRKRTARCDLEKRRYCESEGEKGRREGGKWVNILLSRRTTVVSARAKPKKMCCDRNKSWKTQLHKIPQLNLLYIIFFNKPQHGTSFPPLLLHPPSPSPFPSIPMSGPSIELSPDCPWQSLMFAKLVSCNVSSPLVLCKPQGSVFL